MKTTFYFLISLLLVLNLNGLAQHQHNNDSADNHKNKFELMKIGFLTEKLDLSIQEAQLFWPVFNNYEAERKQIMGDHKKVDFSKISDKDADALLASNLDKETKLLALKKSYVEKFKKVLPAKKVLTLYQLGKRHGKGHHNGFKHDGDKHDNCCKHDGGPDHKCKMKEPKE